ncbi:MAG: hypothetical protein B7Z40_21295 [Bosea sp. 12-68-7]|nr:MAG: hypothetical protein B7Z40_21295 [Bosea sp. 12-68-7]
MFVRTEMADLGELYAEAVRLLLGGSAERRWPIEDIPALFGDWAGRKWASCYLQEHGLDDRFVETLCLSQWGMHRLIANLPLFENRWRIRAASRAYEAAAIALLDELDEAFGQAGGTA